MLTTKFLKEGEWLVGNKLTLADFWIGGLYTNYFANPNVGHSKEWFAETLAKYPAFEAYGKKFAEANAEHLAKRPDAPA